MYYSNFVTPTPIVCAVGLQMVSLLATENFFQQILWNIMNICIWDVRGQVNLKLHYVINYYFLNIYLTQWKYAWLCGMKDHSPRQGPSTGSR